MARTKRRFWVGVLVLPIVASAAELRKPTLDAYEKYTRQVEAGLAQKVRTGRFLWVDDSAERVRGVRQGEIVVGPVGSGEVRVPDGLIHDWIAAVFIPGVTLDQTLALVHDYNNHKYIYRPGILESKLLSRTGNDYKTAVRLANRKFVTVVLDAEYDIRYVQLDEHRWMSESRSTKFHEVENPGKPNERDLPDGTGHGYLWRLNSYSRFEQRDGGVYVECEAVSLSRGLPFGLAWLIRPMIRDLPGEHLSHTLTAMRTAVLAVESGRLRLPGALSPLD